MLTRSLFLAAPLIASSLNAQGAPRAAAFPPESLVVSTAWVAQRVGQPGLVILDINATRDTMFSFARAHVPGAQRIEYMEITADVGGLTTELPPADSLRSYFERRGVGDGARVVIYSDDPVQAARAFWALDYLGVARVSIMSGGMSAWQSEGRTLEPGAPRTVPRGRITTTLRPEIVANADYLTTRIGKPGFFFADTRTVGEYEGIEGRRGLPSTGHVQGAKLTIWQNYMADSTQPRSFKTREQLAAMLSGYGMARGDTVVAYCFIGYRASMSYFVARYVGVPVKIYDGSYQDWAAKGLPTVKPNR